MTEHREMGLGTREYITAERVIEDILLSCNPLAREVRIWLGDMDSLCHCAVVGTDGVTITEASSLRQAAKRAIERFNSQDYDMEV